MSHYTNGKASVVLFDLIEGCGQFVPKKVGLTDLSRDSCSKLICPMLEETLHHCHCTHPQMCNTAFLVNFSVLPEDGVKTYLIVIPRYCAIRAHPTSPLICPSGSL